MKICISLSVKQSIFIQGQISLSDTVLQTLCFSKPVFGWDFTILPLFFNYRLSRDFLKCTLRLHGDCVDCKCQVVFLSLFPSLCSFPTPPFLQGCTNNSFRRDMGKCVSCYYKSYYPGLLSVVPRAIT